MQFNSLKAYLLFIVSYGTCLRHHCIFNFFSPIPSLQSKVNDFSSGDSTTIKCIYQSIASSKIPVEGSSDDAKFLTANDFGVFDGVGSWNKIGVDCGKYTSSLASSCRSMLSVERNSVGRLYRSSRKSEINLVQVLNFAQENAKRNDLVGSTTVCMVSIDEVQRYANILNLGDSGTYIFRRPKENAAKSSRSISSCADLVFRTEAKQHFFDTPFQIGNSNNIPSATNYFSELNGESLITSTKYGSIPFDKPSDSSVFSVPLEVGDVVLVATDGLFDNINTNDIMKIIVDNIFMNIKDISDSESIDDAIKVALQTLLRTAQFNAASHAADNITPWSVSTAKEMLRIRRQIESSIFAWGKSEWSIFEDYIIGLPQFAEAIASDSSYNGQVEVDENENEVFITVDAKCDAIKDLFRSRTYPSFLPAFLNGGDSYSSYDYSEKTNSFRVTVKIGSRTVPVRIQVAGGKPDDITIILVVIA
jgi:serine/threonine protein phosphatase PrpC